MPFMSGQRRFLRLTPLLLVAGCAEAPFDEGRDASEDVSEATGELPGAIAVSVCGTSIQSAINAAANGSVLEICPGTYNERLVINGKNLELRGVSGPNVTIINAGSAGRALEIDGATGTGVFVNGLTLRNGRTSGFGGGIDCNGSKLKMRNSVLASNVGSSGGGGLYATGCTLDVGTSRFESNNGGSEQGGGAYIVNSTGQIASSTFTSNKAGHGGGIATEGGSADIVDCEISHNTATSGAGLYLDSDGDVIDSDIVENDASWIGGGIYVDTAEPTIQGCTIDGNTSVNDGGGFYVHQSAVEIIDCHVLNNFGGDDGGGIRIFESEALIQGCLIEDNTAADSGGGIRISHLPTRVFDNVVKNNTANQGGGADLDNCSSQVKGGIFEGNTANGSGGAIAMGLAPWNGASISDVQFVDNYASSKGGGIYLFDNYQKITMRGLTFRDNLSGRGGGLYVRSTNYTLQNSVFDHNDASGDGGAIHIAAYSWSKVCPCPPTSTTGVMDFITFFDNDADDGSALYTFVNGITLRNSILFNNEGTQIYVDGTSAPTLRYNDILPRSFGGMSDPTGSNGNISADPLFVSAASSNFNLSSSSPAKDAGDPALLDKNGSRADMGMFGGPAGGPAACTACPAPPLVATLQADAEVRQASPSSNFGSASSINADTSPVAHAYLRFNISGATGVNSAKLRLNVTNGTADAPQLFLASTNAWGETTINWNNKPATSGGVIDDEGSIGSGSTIEYDVGDVVTGNGTFTFVLVPTSTDGMDFTSKEGAVAPQLLYTLGSGGGGGAVCGDGTCNGSETCSSCASDCGVCPVVPTGTMVADAEVRSASPTTNYGNLSTLAADGDPVVHGYLRFTVTNVISAPTSVKLRLAVTDATSNGPAIYRTSGGWTETGLTFNNKPATIGGAIHDLGAMSIGQFVEYDLTSVVTANGTYDFVLIPTSTSGVIFSSRTGSNPPQIVIQ